MLIRRNSPTKRTARTADLLIGQWSFPWRSVFLTHKASNLELSSPVELGTSLEFTGREQRAG